MIQSEGSFATPEDESAQVVLATPLTEEARSETPAQNTIGQSPSAEKSRAPGWELLDFRS